MENTENMKKLFDFQKLQRQRNVLSVQHSTVRDDDDDQLRNALDCYCYGFDSSVFLLLMIINDDYVLVGFIPCKYLQPMFFCLDEECMEGNRGCVCEEKG